MTTITKHLHRILRCVCRLFVIDPLSWVYTHFVYMAYMCCPRRRVHSLPPSTYILEHDLVVHERQCLQLCAVHTINNLLQLSPDCEDIEWICESLQLSKPPCKPATQSELDRIAGDLTRAENALLTQSTTWWRHCWSKSNHRTLYYGNYSFETLQVALEDRKITLEWFPPQKVLGADWLHTDDGMIVGFVVNSFEGEEDANCCDSVCRDSMRHWYAISRVRRTNDEDVEAHVSDRWKILDSDRPDETRFLDEDELQQHLKQLSSSDASLFRAILNR